jgi:NAD+--asparagine ADP-ribosyltransferase
MSNVDTWKADVKKKYSSIASRLRFKSAEQGKQIIAEIPGEDRCYGVFDVEKDSGEVLGESILVSYLETSDNLINSITFEMLEEALNMAKVTVSQLTKKEIPELKDEVFTIKNESSVIDSLITLLGIPRDGTAYKIRTGFMAYDDKNKILFFSKNKYDLPSYLSKRPQK